jgi:hypothetical protein
MTSAADALPAELLDQWVSDLARSVCTRPVRLHAVRTTVDQATGEILASHGDDRPVLANCGNRRAAVCPSCSRTYQGDMWHLLHCGVAGGKGVPETVASHPTVFATLTAPSFGPVHTTRRDRTGQSARCRPRRVEERCPHGRLISCGKVHAEHDPQLGQPLCADCYDYTGHIVWQLHAPELWRRFTITLRRVLAHELGLTSRAFNDAVRVSYAKVAEFQRRGVVHFHALIRLDGPGDGYPPPAVAVPVPVLELAIRQASAHVRLTVSAWRDGTPGLLLRFGAQTDTRPVRHSAGRDDAAGPMHPRMVAAYIAKYATKAAEDFGLPDRLAYRELPRHAGPHVTRLVETVWQLAPHFDRLGRWAHMLGFAGHFASKSRRYSVTLGSLRRERRTWRAGQQTGADLRELDADADPDGDDTTVVISSWTYAGRGHLNTAEAWLANEIAARARAHRRGTQIGSAR